MWLQPPPQRCPSLISPLPVQQCEPFSHIMMQPIDEPDDVSEVDKAEVSSVRSLMTRSQSIHGNKIVVATGPHKGFLVVVVDIKGRCKTCLMCGGKSTDPSPFTKASNEDQYGGYRPWQYSKNAKLLLRPVKGNVCLICWNIWRLEVPRCEKGREGRG